MRTLRAVVYAVGAGLALTACSSGGGSTTVDGQSLKVGDCFNQSDAQVDLDKVDLVPCTEQHLGEVYLVARGSDISNASPDFSETMISEWEKYTGATYDPVNAYGYIISGDPLLVVASIPAEGTSTGSVRGN